MRAWAACAAALAAVASVAGARCGESCDGARDCASSDDAALGCTACVNTTGGAKRCAQTRSNRTVRAGSTTCQNGCMTDAECARPHEGQGGACPVCYGAGTEPGRCGSKCDWFCDYDGDCPPGSECGACTGGFCRPF